MKQGSTEQRGHSAAAGRGWCAITAARWSASRRARSRTSSTSKENFLGLLLADALVRHRGISGLAFMSAEHDLEFPASRFLVSQMGLELGIAMVAHAGKKGRLANDSKLAVRHGTSLRQSISS